ncbi:MotA/TolQ/ExbB proton channel family protein [Agarivorans sp. QJM3NY_33]|uniref:MotA/TolQ/ExbB proton channel family protein n=1 Tax=Agarivorans sp. QJM3NY_33 TaxID=3421432 RepID=UPI003D7EFEDC
MRILSILLFTLFSFSTPLSAAEPSHRLASLATDILQHDGQVNQQRLAEFKQHLDSQKALLAQSQQRLAAANARQLELKQAFDQNEQHLTEIQQLLTQRSGQLGEVFGVVKQQASEAQGQLQDSLVSAQFPGRSKQLDFASAQRIPSIDEFKTLWVSLYDELNESGKIVLFERDVVEPSGQTRSTQVLRIGNFQLLDQQGHYLSWQNKLDQLLVLSRQPDGAAVNQAKAYIEGKQASLVIDPTRGQLLALLGQVPSLEQRIKQGGYVGYIILALGLIGLVMALWRMLLLSITEMKVKRQLKNSSGQLFDNNPLGRVLNKAQQSELAVDDLALRVEESILEEVPGLERGQSLIKLFAAVAPLLGLLGTVTGMIGTFQSITLFGTSDPKLMAGGISQALITTVLGLIVAIPLLFSHNLLSSRSRRVIQILQQKSTALLADRREVQQVRSKHAA